MTTVQPAPHVKHTDYSKKLVTMPSEKELEYIANCKVCTLATAMKDCPRCLFNIGLLHRIAESMNVTAVVMDSTPATFETAPEVEEDDEVPYGCCPSCGDVLTSPNHGVCLNCGKRIWGNDWQIAAELDAADWHDAMVTRESDRPI